MYLESNGKCSSLNFTNYKIPFEEKLEIKNKNKNKRKQIEESIAQKGKKWEGIFHTKHMEGKMVIYKGFLDAFSGVVQLGTVQLF